VPTWKRIFILWLYVVTSTSIRTGLRWKNCYFFTEMCRVCLQETATIQIEEDMVDGSFSLWIWINANTTFKAAVIARYVYWLSLLGVICGVVGGCVSGISCWLGYASTYPGGLSGQFFVKNTGQVNINGICYLELKNW
jgi:hypothetical protein